jgi:hypothetical protein
LCCTCSLYFVLPGSFVGFSITSLCVSRYRQLNVSCV